MEPYKDKLEITTYWKDQEPPKDSKTPFVDSYFPPNDNSLLSKNKEGEFIDKIVGAKKAATVDEATVEWKRLSEIFKEPFLFEDKIECDDIKQGTLGNCYFLSSLAALAEYPRFIYNIFKTKEVSPTGFYELCLFIDGAWQIVFVDDYVPVLRDSGNFLFCKPNGKELWCVLLEKAWAKINGGYTNTITGWPNDPLTTMTGFSSKKITHETCDVDDLFQELHEADRSDCIMCVTSNQETDKGSGIVSNHAYTLIEALEIADNKGDTHKLVKIRNPWGHSEWKGDWSDNSPFWTEALRRKYSIQSRDDGIFFMSAEDLKAEFRCSHICKIEYGTRYKFCLVEGEELAFPQVYNLHVPEDASVSISAIRPHERFNRHLKGNTYPISLCVAKYSSEYKFTSYSYDFEGKLDADIVEDLTEGNYLIWFYTPFEHLSEPKIEKLVLRVYSTEQFNLEYRGKDLNFAVIRSIIMSDLSQKFSGEIEAKKGGIFGRIVNYHKCSGIGFFFASNQHSRPVHYKLDNQVTKMVLFKPFSEETSEFTLGPGKSTVILGIRTSTQGRYWFNLKNKATWLKEDEYEKVNEFDFEAEAVKFMDGTIEEKEVPDEFYDRIDKGVVESTEEMQFDKIDTGEDFFEKLKKTNPEVHKMIFEFEDCWGSGTWTRILLNNGVYIGQVNGKGHRQGVGYYKWKNGKEYIGEWKAKKKSGKGKMFSEGRLNYEGQFEEGVKSGEGTLYFKNGDVYKGGFLNDKQNGKCLYTWKKGVSWRGSASNNKLHGTGIFTDMLGNKREMTYEFGRAV